MRQSISFLYPDTEINALYKVISIIKDFDIFSVLHSNNYSKIHKGYFSYNTIIAAGAVNYLESSSNSLINLQKFINKSNDWLFGHLSYDLKNEIEPKLSSTKPNFVGFPNTFFFQPKFIIIINNNSIQISALGSMEEANNMKNLILSNNIKPHFDSKSSISFTQRTNYKDYINDLLELKQHLQYGNIYEINYCREFYSEQSNFCPISAFKLLNKSNPSPFAALYKLNDKYLISASPERYLKKIGNKLISQPMKGTIARLSDKVQDNINFNKLKTDIKERAENVMITDLVRNDLSKTAKSSSVKVSELFGIYSFPNVHQMITTIESEPEERYKFKDFIATTFPMGSMTGAPKFRAMQLIDEYEKVSRGLFSGSVGYINPNGDFDFNVIIRSLLYNTSNKYLSLSTGGAITIKSNPDEEYNETEIKAKSVSKIFEK